MQLLCGRNIQSILILLAATIIMLTTRPAANAAILFEDDSFFDIRSNGIVLDFDDQGGDITIQFGTTLNETITWNSAKAIFEFSDDIDMNSHEIKEVLIENVTSLPGGASGLTGDDTGRIVQLTATDTTAPRCTITECPPGTYIWNGFWKALDHVRADSAPPFSCVTALTGFEFFDTDTGITYMCDGSNSRNKWLSIGEFMLTGSDTSACAAGAAPSTEACTQDIHNGTDANDMGYQIPRDATIVGGSFHSDLSCTDGSGVDLEVADRDNGAVAYLADILTGCTDPNGCSAVGIDIDVDANDIIRARLDNNCSTGSVDDWSSIIVLRWRHD